MKQKNILCIEKAQKIPYIVLSGSSKSMNANTITK